MNACSRTGQSGGAGQGACVSSLGSVLPTWAATRQGPSPCLRELVAQGPAHLATADGGAGRSWIQRMEWMTDTLQPLQGSLIYFEFLCALVINEFYRSIVGTLTNLGIKL